MADTDDGAAPRPEAYLPGRTPGGRGSLKGAILRLMPGRLPPRAVALALKLTTKRMLRRLDEPSVLRAALEADADQVFRAPAGAAYTPVTVGRGRGARGGLWAEIEGRLPVAPPTGGRVVLYFHGGAYIAGSPGTHRHLGAALAGAAGARVLLVDYRRAPEHPLPAALADARAAWEWLRREGVAPERVALAGDSAGGGLAFALLADLTADRRPLPGAVVAFSPWTDMRGTAASLQRNRAADAMLPAERFDDLIGHCLGAEGARDDWRVSPVLARYERPPPAM
ncbi:MAG: alpha/beta hydrolase fold domain-containing protein, partial [Pseudomonadota bacterium]